MPDLTPADVAALKGLLEQIMQGVDCEVGRPGGGRPGEERW